ncbi:MAG TPA: hypothetical protein VN081_02220 [Dongiaceae bacterium]|nr:hypothetical protein [Dongiaceae bacterium]
MAQYKPMSVKKNNITSTDIVGFSGGLDERSPYLANQNTFNKALNMAVDSNGFLIPRPGAKKWLPSLVGKVKEVFPVLYNGDNYYFVVDDGRVKYVQSGDLAWTEIGTLDTPATYTTALAGTNEDLVFTAVQKGYLTNPARGVLGNGVTVAYVNNGASKPLLVTVSGLAITVQLATNSSSVITSTGSQVMAAINSTDAVKPLITASLAAGNTGAGLVTVMTAKSLTGGADGTNHITTDDDLISTFVRTNDQMAVINGVDKMRYVDLQTMKIVQYNLVTDPANAPTAAGTGMSGSTAKVYYAISFNGNAGTTNISPILTQTGDPRTGWASTTKFMTVTRNNSAPAGANSWNIYICLSSQTGTPTVGDMLLLASDLDMSTLTYIDDGTVSPQNILAPTDNTTEGAKVKYGIEEQGLAIFWGDPDNPYRVYIGGIDKYALQFSAETGGYISELHKGTNYYPLMVTGFRTGQGLPAITVLFGNTQGISKQSTLTQQTVTVGNSSQSYWTETEQNYGAPSVASPYGLVNYNGILFFVSYNGIMTIKTNQNALNVLNTTKIDQMIPNTFGSIRSDQFDKIIACAWDNKVYFSVPSRGYEFNNQILVYDMSNANAPIWYIWDIQADYIGVISTSDQEAFVYYTKDNNIFRLEDNYVAQDEDGSGIASPFATSAAGTFLGMTPAHNYLKVVKQATFYYIDAIGNITEGVTWTDRFNKPGFKDKVVPFGEYSASTTGGWDDPFYQYDGGNTAYNNWDDTAPITSNDVSTKQTKRDDLSLDNAQVIELQWSISTQLDYSAFKLRSVSYEGVNIGVRGDIR